MEIDFKNELTNYSLNYPLLADAFEKAVDIIKKLSQNNLESYIFADAIRLILKMKPFKEIKIVSMASLEDLKNLLNGIAIDKEKELPFVIENKIKIYFYNFVNFSKGDANVHYNQRLSGVLKAEHFSVNAFALSPNLVLTSLYHADEDNKLGIIRPIEKPKILFDSTHQAILEAYLLIGFKGYHLSFNLANYLKKYKDSNLRLTDLEMVRFLKEALLCENSLKVFRLLGSHKIFTGTLYGAFVEKILPYFKDLDYLEALSILYLLIGEVIDPFDFSKDELQIIKEKMMITRLLISTKVTPMIVYNIGKEMLYSANKIACVYKNKYVSQASLIAKLDKDATFTNLHELNITRLEIASLLPESEDAKEKSLIVLNLIIERVINKEVENTSFFLKNEAKKIIRELDSIFSDEDEEIVIETEYDLTKLLERYNSEHEFLVKVYLNDEKALYNLSPIEREELKEEASEHATSFLGDAKRYQELRKRGLI